MSDVSLVVVPESIRPYLNEIAERLWSGHAAVMIGAGFSRNARPNGNSCPGFPDWSQLGDLFYERIHGRKPDNQKYLNVLKLADEVQAAFGRPTLDQLLRSAIPDKDYEPSDLHVKLLDLPWADVFTTNYDTLLERASASATSQKYDVVINKDDLVYSEKPRIIKLHGSFPSERPFIITEEDYRQYPKDFSPFVNTVQQGLLENTLCMIGFSGDDPNFLQWIGWIRDNLGKQNSPKIYLVGIFNLTDAQKKLLEQRNIVLVDLSSCPEIEGDHYKVLERFFDYLLSRKSEDNRLGWPNGEKHLHPDHNVTDNNKQLIELLVDWKQQRLSYPGWCILPEDRRSYLWIFTQQWISFNLSKYVIPAPLDIEFLYELTWRVDKCLCPVFDSQAEKIEGILVKYSPFPENRSLSPQLVSPEMPEYKELDWAGIKIMWVRLSLSMLRYYREEGLLGKWQTIDKNLEELKSYLSSDDYASLHYERALYALFELDLPEIRKQLNAWQFNESLPFWEAKRAGLLAEIGQTDEAEKILEQSLGNIRSKLNLKPITTDYSLVSQEAFTMLLLQYVRNSASFRRGKWSINEELRQQFTERWNALKNYKCDPWNELKLFESCLERTPSESLEFTVKKGFDIGRVMRTHHMRSWDEEAIFAFSFLRFCEDAGIPFRIPGHTFGKKSGEGTLKRISKYSPYWAMATMVRIGDDKIVDRIFNRESLHKLENKFVDDLIDGYLKALERSRIEIQAGNSFTVDNFGILLAHIVPEILSRLCCKCSHEARVKLLDFLLKVYKSAETSKYRGIRNLTDRLLRSFPCHQRFEVIPKILEFPVLTNLDHNTANEFVNPFEFLDIDKELTANWEKPEISENLITSLLANAVSEIPDLRKWSIYSLVELYQLDLLAKPSIDKLGEVIWAQQDDYGFPEHTDYYKFAFLNLPHPEDIDPVSLFKKYIQVSPFPIQKNSTTTGIPITGGDVPICAEIIGASRFVRWTDGEVRAILLRLVDWWDADKAFLRKDEKPAPFGSTREEFRARFSKLVTVLVEVVAPTLSKESEDGLKATVRRLLSELQEFSLPVLRAEAACIKINPERKTEIIARTEDALASNDLDTVLDGLRAAVLVILEQDPDMSHLLCVIGQMVRWRRRIRLPSVLITIKNLAEKQPSLFIDNFERLTLKGLQCIADDTDLTVVTSEFDFSERLEIRKEAAGLAYVLFEHYLRLSKPIPGAIQIWQVICRSNSEFAEIQNEWLAN